MNKELIQKVQQGTHCIEFNIGVDDFELLQDILHLAFPKDDWDIGGVCKYYGAHSPNSDNWQGFTEIISLKPIPIKDFLIEELPLTEEAPLQEVRDKEEGIKKSDVLKYLTIIIRGNGSETDSHKAAKLLKSEIEVIFEGEETLSIPQPASNETPVKEEGKEYFDCPEVREVKRKIIENIVFYLPDSDPLKKHVKEFYASTPDSRKVENP